RGIATASAAYLMAEDAADHSARYGARHVHVTAELAPFDPATLLRRPDDGMHRRDRHFIRPLVAALAVTLRYVAILRDIAILRNTLRCVAIVRDVAIAVMRAIIAVVVVTVSAFDRTHGRNIVLHAHVREGSVLTRLQHHATSAEARIFANLPVPAVDDRGRCLVVEAGPIQVLDRSVGTELLTTEILARIERHLCCRRRGDGQRGGAHCCLE
ncbi:MAG TPA: hypothetical protein VKU81_12010, partial [Casimicrobiaceae bacterium]|nr:hypothetical protein [Casimicrobiaceae bacterium]